jgi:hypothetical protein
MVQGYTRLLQSMVHNVQTIHARYVESRPVRIQPASYLILKKCQLQHPAGLPRAGSRCTATCRRHRQAVISLEKMFSTSLTDRTADSCSQENARHPPVPRVLPSRGAVHPSSCSSTDGTDVDRWNCKKAAERSQRCAQEEHCVCVVEQQSAPYLAAACSCSTGAWRITDTSAPTPACARA